MNRQSSPMATLSANTMNTEMGKEKSNARRSESPLLPDVALTPSVQALIQESASMLSKLEILQHEVDKQTTLCSKAEAQNAKLTMEVDDLRNRLGMATVDATDSSGKIINYKKRCEDLEQMVSKLKEDNDSLKALMESTADRVKHYGCQDPNTARATKGGAAQEQITHHLPPLNEMCSACRFIPAEKMKQLFLSGQRSPDAAAAALTEVNGTVKKQMETARDRLKSVAKDTAESPDAFVREKIQPSMTNMTLLVELLLNVLEDDLKVKASA